MRRRSKADFKDCKHGKGLDVHLGVPFSTDAEYDFGDPKYRPSYDSSRKILAGRDDGSDDGISLPRSETDSQSDLRVSRTPATR